MRWRRWGGSSVRKGLSSGRASSRDSRAGAFLEGRVQRQHLPGHFGADGAGVVALVDMDIAPEQVEHGEVRGRLAVGYGGAFQDPPALGLRRVEQLVR